jgi:Zn-dependent protease with chaperone function
MDFFERQEKARRNTKLLVFYFALAVIVLVVMGYFAGLMIFAGAQSRHHFYSNQEIQFALWNPPVFLAALVGTLGVIIGGSAFKTAQLAEGGCAVATTLGGRPIASNTTDPDERKLLNVVEEMAIASGVPMPQVYVLDEEKGINAFAAGHAPSDAVIGVTRGCITLLKRDELQGVIGHEFSHILNGDMRLNLRLLGVIFGILCIATIGRILLRTRGSGRDRNALPLLGLVLLLLGSAGVLFGRLIQAAVSRQREFLADASSVQFTRNPTGLSGALQKIGRYSFGSRLESEHAADACHMFFGNGLNEPFFGLVATHPPIDERIRAIDPGWDGKFPPIPKELFEPVQRAAVSDLKHSPLPSVLNTVLGGAIIAAGSPPPPVIKPHSVLPNLGNPTALHLRYAEELRNSFPESVKSAAHDPLSAVALVYSLLLSGDETTRATQLQELAQRTTSTIHEKTAALFPEVATIALRARLPLVNLALPALRQLRADEFEQFSQTLQWLIESDREIDLFEYVLQKIIRRHLAPRFGKARPPVIQYYSVKPLLPDCSVVLSALANVSSDDASEVEKAFETGAPYLRSPDGALQLLPQAQCSLAQIDAALGRLAQAVPQIKKNLIEACVHTVGADGVIQEREAELLRAVADTLDCPIPPFVQGISPEDQG